MKTFLRWTLLVSLVSTPVLAHHGNAAFDVGKTRELKGTVTEWIWANPHCWLKFDVTEGGKTVNWSSRPPTRPTSRRKAGAG